MTIVLSTQSRRPDFDVFRSRNPDFVADLPALRNYKKRRLRQLQSLSRRKQRSKVRSILTDQRLLRLYAYKALRKTGNLRTATATQIDDMAAEANLFQPCREHQRINIVRSRRREREVYSFGPQKRMRQMFASDVIRALHPPHASQKLFHGGMPAARRAVDAAYFEHGMRYCVEVDFINFYGAIPWEGLAGVLRPLPLEVVRHVLWDLTIRREGQGIDFHSQSPVLWSDPHRIGATGLPLGSACSPAVGECILAQFLRDVPYSRYVSYADNILLFGRDEAEMQAVTENFQEMVHNGNSPMRFRVDEILRINPVAEMASGFEFLGQYASIPDDDNDYSGFIWRPNANKISEYRIEEWLPEASDTELDEAEAKVINWVRAYPEWPEGNQAEAHSLAEIACLRYFQSPSPLHERRAISAVASALIASDIAGDPAYFIPDIPPYTRQRLALISACQNWLDTAINSEAQPSGPKYSAPEICGRGKPSG